MRKARNRFARATNEGEQLLKAGAFAQQIAGYAANLPTIVLSVGHAKVHFYRTACIFRILISVGGDTSARGSVKDFKITPVFEFFPLDPLHLISPVHPPPYRYPLAGQSRSLPEDSWNRRWWPGYYGYGYGYGGCGRLYNKG